MVSKLDLVFLFEDLSQKSVVTKKIVNYFKRAGLNVVQVDDPQKLKRTSGISYKELNIILADGESILLRVKQSGDIYQVLINGKVIPIKHQDDQREALNEVIARSKADSSAFQKRLSRQKAKEIDPENTRASKRMAITTKMKILKLTEKRDTLLQEIQEAQEVLAELQ